MRLSLSSAARSPPGGASDPPEEPEPTRHIVRSGGWDGGAREVRERERGRELGRTGKSFGEMKGKNVRVKNES